MLSEVHPSAFRLYLLPPQPRAPELSGHCRTQLRAPDLSGHCRTSTASSRSQWALPDLNRELQISVGTAGPQPRAPDLSGHCRTQLREPDLSGHRRTSAARARSQRALRDLNCERKVSHRMPARMSYRMPDRMSDRMPDRMPERM